MLDIFIIILLLWAAFSGWRNGFVKEVVSTVGFLAGLLIAALCYSQLGQYLTVTGSETNMTTSIIAFLLLWIVVPIFLGLAATIVTKALKGMKLGLPNSLLGAAVSALKYFILISCVLNVMQALNILNPERSADSRLLSPVTGALNAILPADSTQLSHPDADAATADTVWIDVSKK